ncbi:MAG: hypothetical protein WAM91_12270 [Candidatus Acidiferrales bacterium]
MKRILCLLLVVAFAGAMLLPVASHVNLHPGNRIQLVDNGGPQPPWPPPPPPGSGNGYVPSLSV